MTKGSFHIHNSAKRRGEGLPARLRIVARRGTTLVELLIAMLILTIVCIAWLEIIGIQSARKEARRREAVERLAGMMDAFVYWSRSGTAANGEYVELCGYSMATNNNQELTFVPDSDLGTNDVHSVFESSESPIGYQLCVVNRTDLPNANSFTGWNTQSGLDTYKWLIGRLYERNGTVNEVGRPFFTLQVCLGADLE